MLTSFDVVLFAFVLLSGLALVFCAGNAARAGIETQAYASATPDLRLMHVSEATVTGGPAIQDWTAGPTGWRRGLRLCRLDLQSQGTDHLASLDPAVCGSVARGQTVQARLWNGNVTEVRVDGMSWPTLWNPRTGIVAWLAWSLLDFPVALLFAAMLRFDLHGRLHRVVRRRLVAPPVRS